MNLHAQLHETSPLHLLDCPHAGRRGWMHNQTEEQRSRPRVYLLGVCLRLLLEEISMMPGNLGSVG